MELIQRITPREMNFIKAYIEAYGDVDGDGCAVTVDMAHILRFWNTEKAALGRLFGDKLIVSRNVSIAKPLDILQEDIRQNCLVWDSEGRAFYSDFLEWCRTKYRDQEISYGEKEDLCSLTGTYFLAKNTYDGRSFHLTDPKGNRIDINNGCKCTKILGKLNRAFNISSDENFEKFRIAHSMCLNQKMMKGELCLSIHPLDFMTMSDNCCNWESCMSWMNTGDYRQGTVEMMNSPYMVVAYLTSSTPMQFALEGAPDFEWNSKKWRQLFVASPDILFGIKHYPFHSDDLTKICLDWMRDLAEKNGGWGPYTQEPCKISNGRAERIPELGSQLYCEFEMAHMYNDIHRDHSAYIAVATGDPIMGKSRLIMHLSGKTECMTCGREILDLDDIDPDELQCHRCHQGARCEHCGGRLYDHNTYWIGDTAYCEDCYYELTVTCHNCEEVELKDECYKIYLRHNGQVTGYYIYICEDCYADSNADWRRHCGPDDIHSQGLWYVRTYYCVDSFNLDDEGWEMFGIARSERRRMIEEIQNA